MSNWENCLKVWESWSLGWKQLNALLAWIQKKIGLHRKSKGDRSGPGQGGCNSRDATSLHRKKKFGVFQTD